MRSGLLVCMIGFVGLWMGTAYGKGAPLPQQLQSVVDTYLKTRMAAEKISGVALHVDLAGQEPVDVYAGSNGRRDARPIDGRTLFQIGSNTKQFTAALVLKLEAEGKLSIDQTVGHWLPQYTGWADVTIGALLNMTSDISNYSEAVSIAETLSADMHHQFDYDDLIDAVYGKGLPVATGYF
jgi:D-alanyl-D-alanine carboxypeptidase